MKVGIFGGSFNPIHNHHIRIAKAAKLSLELDEIWFIPVFCPVHKFKDGLLEYDSRKNLIEKAISEYETFKLVNAEQQLGGPSYTIRTVSFLQSKFPEHDFVLIIGGDALSELSGWKEAKELVAKVPIVAISRPGSENNCQLAQANIIKLSVEESDISGTQIRNNFNQHIFNNICVPIPVFQSIIRNNYYNSLGEFYSKLSLQIHTKLSELAPGLQNHIFNVADLCIEYCLDLGIDPRLGLISGLSHDLYRAAKPNVILEAVKKGGYELLSLEERIPMLAHGAAAASYLKEICPDIPTSILEAVRWHTLLNDKPHKLLMALAMADTLEVGRKDEVRSKIYKSKVSALSRYDLVCQFKRDHRREKAAKDINIK